MPWLSFPKLGLSSEHGLFLLGVLGTATTSYKVNMMDMNFSTCTVSWELAGARHGLRATARLETGGFYPILAT